MLTAEKPNELRKRYVKLRKEFTSVYQAIGEAKAQRSYDVASLRNKNPTGFRLHCDELRTRQQKLDAEFESFLTSLNMPDGKEKDWRRVLRDALGRASERLGRVLYRKELTSYLDENGNEVPVYADIEDARKKKHEIETELDIMIFGLIKKTTAT
jgi:hypothetical protein